MTTMTVESPQARFREASDHLYSALCDRFGHNLRADQPIVRAISEYGAACRAGADVEAASGHVYAALRHALGSGWGANQEVIRTLSEYGEACREVGARA